MGGNGRHGSPGTADGPVMEGIVLWTMNEWYAVLVDGREWRCRLRGVLRKGGRAAVLPVIGDRVTLRPTGEGEGVIEAVAPRRSTFSRRAAGPKGAWREQVLAANIDQVFVVFAAAKPDPHPRAVDRFLVIAEANELPAHLIVNKIDLVGEAAARRRFGVYEHIGYPVRYCSATQRIGLEGLQEELAGKTTLLAGPSGVGKSSLINALVPGLNLRTGPISEALNKGRHTTVVGQLLPLPWGGFVADTPGLREVAPWNIPPEDLDVCFPEFRPYLGQCRFSDCLHAREQGCAVRAAMERGAIDLGRYESYLRLLEEALEAERAVT
jgi:ribosome biogenesis GTPase